MAGCPRCGEPLPADGVCRRCARSAEARVGDATRGRIERLADGWALPVREGPDTDRVLREVHAVGTPVEIEGDDDGIVQIAGDTPPPEPVRPARPARKSRPPPSDRAETVQGPDIGGVLDSLEGELARDPDIPTEQQDLVTPPPEIAARAPVRDDETEISQPPVMPKGPRPPPAPAARRSPTPSRPPPIPPERPRPPATPRAAPPKDDPTTFEPSSPPVEAGPVVAPPLALRRPGIWGDVRYALAVVRGLFRGRRELATMRERMVLEKAARERRLVDVARAAVSDEQITGEAIDAARERLVWLEDQRAQDAAAMQAAEEEAQRAEDERSEARRAAERKLAELDARVAAVEAKLKPVEKEAAERKKAIETHRGQIHAMTKRIDGIERRMGAARDGAERAAAEAELAAARAEHKLMIAEEPKLVAAHAEVLPRIDALQAERTRLQRQAQATRDEHATTDIRLQATAKEAREKRDRADAARRGNEAARDAELAQLGAALDRERPPALRHRFRIVDDHAATIGSIERRILEIETAVAGVHMWAMVRGLGVVALALVLAAILAGLAFRDGV